MLALDHCFVRLIALVPDSMIVPLIFHRVEDVVNENSIAMSSHFGDPGLSYQIVILFPSIMPVK